MDRSRADLDEPFGRRTVTRLAPPRLALLAGLAAAACFGAQFAAGRQGAIAGLSPLDLVTIRFGTAALVMLPVLARLGLSDLGGLGWKRALALTALAGAPYAFVVMLGISWSNAIHAAVLNPGLTPVAGAMLAWLLTRRRPARRTVLGLAAILVGLGLVAGVDPRGIAGGPLPGDAILAASACSYGLYAVLLSRWRASPIAVTATVCVLSAAVCLPLQALLPGPRAILSAPIGTTLLQAAVQGMLAGCVGTFLFAWAASVLGAGTALLFPSLVPIFGTLIAVVALGESLSPAQAAGVAIVSTGMAIAILQPRRPG